MKDSTFIVAYQVKQAAYAVDNFFIFYNLPFDEYTYMAYTYYIE
jgi:hypothetical protein